MHLHLIKLQQQAGKARKNVNQKFNQIYVVTLKCKSTEAPTGIAFRITKAYKPPHHNKMQCDIPQPFSLYPFWMCWPLL